MGIRLPNRTWRDGPVRWGMTWGLSTRKFMILASSVNAADYFFVKIPPHLEVFWPLLGNGWVHSNGSFSHITRTYHEPTIPVSYIYLTHSLWDITNSFFSSPVRRTESYSDTPGVSVSVSVSVKMWKFLVQVIFSFLMFLSTTLFYTPDIYRGV